MKALEISLLLDHITWISRADSNYKVYVFYPYKSCISFIFKFWDSWNIWFFEQTYKTRNSTIKLTKTIMKHTL